MCCPSPVTVSAVVGGQPTLFGVSGKTESNHLEDRLLDQAQAQTPYTPPLFGGHSHSIPQGMILDVQPSAKSFFCPIKRSPNGFFDFEASIPLKLDTTF